jgi:hypothetical protein
MFLLNELWMKLLLIAGMADLTELQWKNFRP